MVVAAELAGVMLRSARWAISMSDRTIGVSNADGMPGDPSSVGAVAPRARGAVGKESMCVDDRCTSTGTLNSVGDATPETPRAVQTMSTRCAGHRRPRARWRT